MAKQGWRYVQDARNIAHGVHQSVDEPLLRSIVHWLENTPPIDVYRAFESIREDATDWLLATPNVRARRKLASQERMLLTAAAMWYGRIAYKALNLLDEHGVLQLSCTPHQAVRLGVRIGMDVIAEFPVNASIVDKVIVDGSGYGGWDDYDEGLLARAERWLYSMGFIDGNVDV